MNGCSTRVTTCLEGITLSPDIKWNLYIRPIAKVAEKIVSSLYSSGKYLLPPDTLYLYKWYRISPQMDYCWHVCAGSARFSLSALKRVQKLFRVRVNDKFFFHSLNAFSETKWGESLSLICTYFYAECSDELHSLVLLVLRFRLETRQVTFQRTNLIRFIFLWRAVSSTQVTSSHGPSIKEPALHYYNFKLFKLTVIISA